MLLRRLAEYADTRLERPLPPLYAESPIRYVIDLKPDGTPTSAQPIDTADPANRRTQRGMRRPVPEVNRSSGIRPLLLADNGEYTLGLARDPGKQDRVDECHRAYMELLARCADETGAPEVQAVARFLGDKPLRHLNLSDEFDPGAKITFTVGGKFVVDLPAVQEFWAREHDPAARGAPVGQCLVCGQERPVLERLQAKIKGIPGGQSSGTSIISANADAFTSYGLEASLVSPTCATCGESFTRGINALLEDPSARIAIAGTVFVAWTRVDVAFDFLHFLSEPKPEDVRELLASVRSGGRVPEVDDTAFYAVALSASGGRAVVRDWIDTTVGSAKASLSRWFELQHIVDSHGGEAAPLGIHSLAGATELELRDVPSPTIRALIRAALHNTPVPSSVLARALQRSRVPQCDSRRRSRVPQRCRRRERVTRQQAAFIKLALLQRQMTSKEEAPTMALNPDNPSVAYQCGRLLATLEDAQRQAIPSINATIVDRFFGTASTAPLSVFPRLMRGAQPHLSRLERDRPDEYRGIQSRLEDIASRIDDFPRTLSLAEQGLFALGYYHQRAHQRAQAPEAAARRHEASEADDASVSVTNE